MKENKATRRIYRVTWQENKDSMLENARGQNVRKN